MPPQPPPGADPLSAAAQPETGSQKARVFKLRLGWLTTPGEHTGRSPGAWPKCWPRGLGAPLVALKAPLVPSAASWGPGSTSVLCSAFSAGVDGNPQQPAAQGTSSVLT